MEANIFQCNFTGDGLRLGSLRASGINGWNAIDRCKQLRGGPSSMSNSCNMRLNRVKTSQKNQEPCISGASKAREKEPIKIAKNTLTTSPAVAEAIRQFHIGRFYQENLPCPLLMRVVPKEKAGTSISACRDPCKVTHIEHRQNIRRRKIQSSFHRSRGRT